MQEQILGADEAPSEHVIALHTEGHGNDYGFEQAGPNPVESMREDS